MERSKDWLLQAQGDLAHAHLDLEHAYYDWACFSAQQSAEKAVKALLNARGADAWGHSVADLLEKAGEVLPVTPGLIDAGLELDKAYISSRYPDALPSGAPRTRYTRGEAERMVGHAEVIVRFGESHLSAP